MIGGDITYITQGAAKYCGWEVELNLPIKIHQANDFLDAVVTYCKIKKEPINPNVKVKEIFGVPVVFRVMPPLIGDEPLVLRLSFPDEKGLFPEDKDCEPLFKRQMATSKKLN